MSNYYTQTCCNIWLWIFATTNHIPLQIAMRCCKYIVWLDLIITEALFLYPEFQVVYVLKRQEQYKASSLDYLKGINCLNDIFTFSKCIFDFLGLLEMMMLSCCWQSMIQSCHKQVSTLITFPSINSSYQFPHSCRCFNNPILPWLHQGSASNALWYICRSYCRCTRFGSIMCGW